jgi:glycosyltransferase involved in cell wall biosynthesis
VIGSAIVHFERATLQAVERRCLELADAIVLVSPADGRVLSGIRADMAAPRAEIVVIPPPAQPTKPRAVFSEHSARYVFVGSDALTQNRLTIDYLCRLWRDHRPSTPLVIYGKQRRTIDYPAGVSAAGYVERIDQIYDDRSILICPSFIGGGVKTKVLEAFAHGAPVIGNSRTFEGLALRGCDLQVDDEAELVALIRDPGRHLARFAAAAAAGLAHVERIHSPPAFARNWRAVILGAAAVQPVSPRLDAVLAGGPGRVPVSRPHHQSVLSAFDLDEPLVGVGQADR